MMKGIHWKKRTLRGRAYWEAVDSDGWSISGVPPVHESRFHPGRYYVGTLDVDQVLTLAEAKQEALRRANLPPW